MLAQKISMEDVGCDSLNEVKFPPLSAGLRGKSSKVTIVITHPLDEIRGCAKLIERLSESEIDTRLLYVTAGGMHDSICGGLDYLNVHHQPEVINLNYPMYGLSQYEVGLTYFLINYCHDTSIFLCPDERGASTDHRCCSAATEEAASRLGAEVIKYQLEKSITSLSMYRLERQVQSFLRH